MNRFLPVIVFFIMVNCLAKVSLLHSLFGQDFSGEICSNGVDDDKDGWVDCDDLDCREDPSCQRDSAPSTAENVPSTTPEDCSNRSDDNGNGLIDCQDSECAGDFSCQNSSNLSPASEEITSSEPSQQLDGIIISYPTPVETFAPGTEPNILTINLPPSSETPGEDGAPNTSEETPSVLIYLPQSISKPAAKQCIPTTCAAQRRTCGTFPDGCGGTIFCGTCR